MRSSGNQPRYHHFEKDFCNCIHFCVLKKHWIIESALAESICDQCSAFILFAWPSRGFGVPLLFGKAGAASEPASASGRMTLQLARTPQVAYPAMRDPNQLSLFECILSSKNPWFCQKISLVLPREFPGNCHINSLVLPRYFTRMRALRRR